MTITLTLGEILLGALGIAGFILIIYLIKLVGTLINTLKGIDLILDDTKEISKVAAEKAKDVDKLIASGGEALGILTDAIKGNQSIAKAGTNLVNAITALIGFLKNMKTQ